MQRNPNRCLKRQPVTTLGISLPASFLSEPVTLNFSGNRHNIEKTTSKYITRNKGFTVSWINSYWNVQKVMMWKHYLCINSGHQMSSDFQQWLSSIHPFNFWTGMLFKSQTEKRKIYFAQLLNRHVQFVLRFWTLQSPKRMCTAEWHKLNKTWQLYGW